MGKIGNMTFILEYGSSNSKIFNGNIVVTSCANMVKISPVTPEIARIKTAPFWMRRQKFAYSTEYLDNYWTDLHQTFSISSHMYGDYKTDKFCDSPGDVVVTN